MIKYKLIQIFSFVRFNLIEFFLQFIPKIFKLNLFYLIKKNRATFCYRRPEVIVVVVVEVAFRWPVNATLSSLSLPPWPAGFDWSSVSCIFFRSSFRLLYASYPASPVRRFLSIFTGRVRSDPKKCAEYSHKIRFRMILSFVWNGRFRCENCAEYSPKFVCFLTFESCTEYSPKFVCFLTFESCAEYFGDWFVYFCLENVQFARNDPLVDVFILVLKVARNVVRVGERQRQVNRQVCGLNLFFFKKKKENDGNNLQRRQCPLRRKCATHALVTGGWRANDLGEWHEIKCIATLRPIFWRKWSSKSTRWDSSL